MKVLHIIATPRGPDSNTLQVSRVFLDALAASHSDLSVDTIDLFDVELPAMVGHRIDAKYTLLTGPLETEQLSAWVAVEKLIEQFLAADAYVISAPMWNFGIPYALKHYIDCLVQPTYTFTLDPESHYPMPLVHGKRMVCVTARGSDYSTSSPMHAYDYQQPYLRAIFGFIGITDLSFISFEPTDIHALRPVAFQDALDQARELAPIWGIPLRLAPDVDGQLEPL